MERGNYAIIGGTGFEVLPPEVFSEQIDVTTVEGTVSLLSISDNYAEPNRLYFLSRHGPQHRTAPHQINYRANALALRELGVKYAIATNAVGSLREDLQPGSLALLDDFIDFTRTRPLTLFSDDEWSHTDFTEPYSSNLRAALLDAAGQLEIPVMATATYICCDGPRFESPAEVRLFRSWGADVVGMTGLPEAIFAREAGIDYAAIAVVTNLAAGLSPDRILHTDVVSAMSTALPSLRELTLATIRLLASSESR